MSLASSHAHSTLLVLLALSLIHKGPRLPQFWPGNARTARPFPRSDFASQMTHWFILLTPPHLLPHGELWLICISPRVSSPLYSSAASSHASTVRKVGMWRSTFVPSPTCAPSWQHKKLNSQR